MRLVTERTRDKRQRYAGRAGRVLDYRPSGRQQPLRGGAFDKGPRKPVLYTSGRIGGFKLGNNSCAAFWNDGPKFDEGRVAYRVKDMMSVTYRVSHPRPPGFKRLCGQVPSHRRPRGS